MDDKIKGLYFIKDLRTDKVIYIGQTIDFNARKRKHFCIKERPIDLYMFEEGRENFSMEMFDIECTNMSKDEMLQKEDELILQYDTINNGLNKFRSGLKSDNYENYKKHKNEYRKSEQYREYCKQYREQNKERLREYHREYCRQYRARKKQEKLANETS